MGVGRAAAQPKLKHKKVTKPSVVVVTSSGKSREKALMRFDGMDPVEQESTVGA